jgi:lipopolysaccharide assembly protein A
VKKIKTFFIVVVTLLILIVIFQNTQAVQTKLLFQTVTMPKALLIIISLLIGFALGVIVTTLLRTKPLSHRDSSYNEKEKNYEKKSGFVDRS